MWPFPEIIAPAIVSGNNVGVGALEDEVYKLKEDNLWVGVAIVECEKKYITYLNPIDGTIIRFDGGQGPKGQGVKKKKIKWSLWGPGHSLWGMVNIIQR